MEGGTGNDIYIVEDAGDEVHEYDNGGTDTIRASISWTLPSPANGALYDWYIENLTLTGTAAIDGIGNELNNIITGNAAANVLSGLAGNDTLRGGRGNDTLDAGDGIDKLYGDAGNDALTGGAGNDLLAGGAGDDAMTGGTGNDIYYVDSTGDSIVESAGEGADSVRTTITWSLGANLESLQLLGSGDINGTGNARANVIRGNSGDNRLAGAAGNDKL